MVMLLASTLGFTWDRSEVPEFPIHTVDVVTDRLNQKIPDFVFNTLAIDDAFVFPETKSLLKVRNLTSKTKRLLELVKADRFLVDKKTFLEMNSLLDSEKSQEFNNFRSGANEIGDTLLERARASEISLAFSNGVQALERFDNEVTNPFEKASAFFLFCVLNEFLQDGNKITSLLMMNGILMSAGINAITIPESRAEEFNEKLRRFCLEKDATEMMQLLFDCHPDAEQIIESNKVKSSHRHTNGMS